MNEVKELISQEGQQLEITEINGRTQIVFKKAILKGKVTQSEVLNTLLIVAKLQGEYYIKKLSKGSPLNHHEVKALKELAEIAKYDIKKEEVAPIPVKSEVLEGVKSSLYAALASKLEQLESKGATE